jgi:hypothetical protein
MEELQFILNDVHVIRIILVILYLSILLCVNYLLYVPLTQFMYKLNGFMQFSPSNMCWPFRPSSSKLCYTNILLSCYYSSTLASVYDSHRGKIISVVYNVNARCNSYASVNIRFLYLVFFLFLRFIFQFYYTKKQISQK